MSDLYEVVLFLVFVGSSNDINNLKTIKENQRRSHFKSNKKHKGMPNPVKVLDECNISYET
jgi:hypothetical protein